jgi:hypothetical protein
MFDKKLQNIIFVAVVIIVVISIILWQNYDNAEKFNNNIVLPQNPQFTGPTHYDPTTGTMMTSPDFIPQHIESAWGDKSTDSQKIEFQKVGSFESATNLGKDTLAFNKCNKSCCSKQYPLPFNLPVDKEIAENMKDFVPSRFTCNNHWEDTGCLCITQNQSNMLANRGNNV